MEGLKRKGYIGNPAQLYTLRTVTLEEGKARGTRVIEVRTAGGLELDILPDNGLDIGQARYKGINMSWLSKNGYDGKADMPYENEFLNTFPGGLLYTCGLRSAGPANRDNGEWHPLHGRYHSLAAEQVCAEEEGGTIVIKGKMRETALFGHVLSVRRVITVPVMGAEVTIRDTVMNETGKAEEYMHLYHCNFGYPLLSEKARLVLPEERETIPRTEFARTGLGRELTFDGPIEGEEERVFFQVMKREFWARLENASLGIAVRIAWSGDTLPVLSQWRSMASGDYVLGLEPSNSYIMGRHAERENGTLPVLGAYETRENTVTISFEEVNDNA
ncbi:MAG: aldose 1-epimerase family protein [Clostridia bacterium]|nr:aldose 1-epimerase family protein [Clostridia bacterium]